MPSQIVIYVKTDPILRDYYSNKYGNSQFIPLRFEYLKNLIRDRSETKRAVSEVFIPTKENQHEYLKVVLPYEADRNVFSYCRLSEKAQRDINSYLRSHFNEIFLNYVAGYLTAQERILSKNWKQLLITEIEQYLHLRLRNTQIDTLMLRFKNVIKEQQQQHAIESFIIQHEINFNDKNYQALKKLWDRSDLKLRCLKEGIIPSPPPINQRNRRFKIVLNMGSLF